MIKFCMSPNRKLRKIELETLYPKIEANSISPTLLV